MSSRTQPALSSEAEIDRYLHERREGPVIVSYAQNGEDIRLWRVFAAKSGGFYVDIGAGHPITHSVTQLFYDAGWRGINVEPGPSYDALASLRPDDINLQLAISTVPGEAKMWITSPDPGLSSLVRPAADLLPPGFTARPEVVSRARLDEVLREHAQDRSIDFLKLDVEGAEQDVIESCDLSEFRPAVLIVEAVSPLDFHLTHEEWEPLLLHFGYVPAAFDGLNRFYVAEEHQDLIPDLEYPVTVLDRYVLHDYQWRRDSSLRDPRHDEVLSAQAALREATRRFEEMQATLSWRITRPLRAVRRLQLRRDRRPRGGTTEPIASSGRASFMAALTHRVDAATRVLCEPGDEPRGQPSSLDDALARFETALESSTSSLEAKAWLGLVAVDGTYPTQDDVAGATRGIRASGPTLLLELMRERFSRSVSDGSASAGRLDVVRNAVVVSTEAMVLTDIHTGIQRVARETVARWLERDHAPHLCSFDPELGALKRLAPSELERVRRWREHLHDSGSPIRGRTPNHASQDPLVPWNCNVIVPELLLERRHSRALAILADAKVPMSLSFICYDLIPIVAPETVDAGLIEGYCEYLSAVKRSDRVSAISRQTARDFTAFTAMLESEGLSGPEVVAQPLPTVAPSLDESELGAGLTALELLGIPLVLVVGVHVPRKNHAAVLEASERLWRRGVSFELLFVGGFESTSGREFDAYLSRLRTDGWSVRIRRRASEAELWAAYHAARFTVYPSLVEGFGLPVAESLAVGTPVITSGHGSMAEIAEGGGALLVDPRSVDDIEDQMRRLLTDDVLLERLRHEARSRDLGSWDRYAHDVWSFLVGEELETSS